MLKKKLYGIMTLLVGVMLVFSIAGCSSGGAGGSPSKKAEKVTYKGTADGVEYSLEITQSSSSAKAAYTPKGGDTYKLTAGAKVSTGTVVSNDAGLLVLQPKDTAADQIKVTVSEAGLTAITSVITWDDGSKTTAAPGTLTPGGGSTSGDDGTPTESYSVTDEQVYWLVGDGAGNVSIGTFSGNGKVYISRYSYYIYNDSDYIQVGTITDGKLSFDMPSTVASNKLYNIAGELNGYAFGDIILDYSQLNAPLMTNDPNERWNNIDIVSNFKIDPSYAKGTTTELTFVNDDDGTKTSLRYSNILSVDYNASDFTLNDMIIYFADRAATVSGTGSYKSDVKTKYGNDYMEFVRSNSADVNVTLVKGWNTWYKTEEYKDSSTPTPSISVVARNSKPADASSMKWSLY